jgi:hypothetical protein
MVAGVPIITSAGTGLDAVVGSDYEWVFGPPCEGSRLAEVLGAALMSEEVRNRLSDAVKTRARAVLQEGRDAIRELLCALEAKTKTLLPLPPQEQVEELFRRVFKYQEASQSRTKTLLIARELEIRHLTDEVLRQNSVIIERDQIIAELRREIESFREGAKRRGLRRLL